MKTVLDIANDDRFTGGSRLENTSYKGAQFSPLTPYQTEDSLPPPVFGIIETRSNHKSVSHYPNNSQIIHKVHMPLDNPPALGDSRDLLPVSIVRTHNRPKSNVDDTSARVLGYNMQVIAGIIPTKAFQRSHSVDSPQRTFPLKSERFRGGPPQLPASSALHTKSHEVGRFRGHPSEMLQQWQSEKSSPFWENYNQNVRGLRGLVRSSLHKSSESQETSARNAAGQTKKNSADSSPEQFYGYRPVQSKPWNSFGIRHRSNWNKPEEAEVGKNKGERLEDDSRERQVDEHINRNIDSRFVGKTNHYPHNGFDMEGKAYFSVPHSQKYRRTTTGEGSGSREEIKWTQPANEADEWLEEHEENGRDEPQVSRSLEVSHYDRNQRRRFNNGNPWGRNTNSQFLEDDQKPQRKRKQYDYSEEGSVDDTNEFRSSNVDREPEEEPSANSGSIPVQKLEFINATDRKERQKQKVEPIKLSHETNEPTESDAGRYPSQEWEHRRLGRSFDKRNLKRNKIERKWEHGRLGRSFDKRNLKRNKIERLQFRDKQPIAKVKEKDALNKVQQTVRDLNEWNRDENREERLFQYEKKLADFKDDEAIKDLPNNNELVGVTVNAATVIDEDHVAHFSHRSGNTGNVGTEKHYTRRESIDNGSIGRSRDAANEGKDSHYTEKENTFYTKRASLLRNATKRNDTKHSLGGHKREQLPQNTSKVNSQKSTTQEKSTIHKDTQQTKQSIMQKFVRRNPIVVQHRGSQNRTTQNSDSSASKTVRQRATKMESNSSIAISHAQRIESSEKLKKKRTKGAEENSRTAPSNITSVLCDCGDNSTVTGPIGLNRTVESKPKANTTNHSQHINGEKPNSRLGTQKTNNSHEQHIGNRNYDSFSNVNQRITNRTSNHRLKPETRLDQQPKITSGNISGNNSDVMNFPASELNKAGTNGSIQLSDNSTISSSDHARPFDDRAGHAHGQEKIVSHLIMTEKTARNITGYSNHQNISANGHGTSRISAKSLQEHHYSTPNKHYSSRRAESNEKDAKPLDSFRNDTTPKDSETTSTGNRTRNRASNANEKKFLDKETFAGRHRNSDRSSDHFGRSNASNKHPLSQSSNVNEKVSSVTQRAHLNVPKMDHRRSREEDESEMTELLWKGHIYGRYSPLSGPFPDVNEKVTSSPISRYPNSEMDEDQSYRPGDSQRFHSPSRAGNSLASQASRTSPFGTQNMYSRRPPSHSRSKWSEETSEGDDYSRERKDERIMARPKGQEVMLSEDSRDTESDEYVETNEREELQGKQSGEQSSSTEEIQPNSSELEPSQSAASPLLDKIPSFEDWLASIPGIQPQQFPFAGSQSGSKHRKHLKIPFPQERFPTQFPLMARNPGSPNFAEFLPQAQSSRQRTIEERNSNEHIVSADSSEERDQASERSGESVEGQRRLSAARRRSGNLDSESGHD
ncbi:hypothetical protein Tcan_08603 [Toxocara canis]|uniref:Uncharacterized protein n=1 Tax=Toxocara canis TaxID=6265 RepID=A0A0B2UYI1_TOXCA|nr:hypothetical protein Tcan_08603 [Toxocara canis]